MIENPYQKGREISPNLKSRLRVVATGACFVLALMVGGIYYQGILNGGSVVVHAKAIPITFIVLLAFTVLMVEGVAFLASKVKRRDINA